MSADRVIARHTYRKENDPRCGTGPPPRAVRRKLRLSGDAAKAKAADQLISPGRRRQDFTQTERQLNGTFTFVERKTGILI